LPVNRETDGGSVVAGLTDAMAIWSAALSNSERILETTPIDKRGDANGAIVDESTKVNKLLGVLMRDQLQHLADVSGRSFRFTGVASTAWDLRDVAGRQADMLQNAVASNKPTTPEFRSKIMQLEGAIQQIWVGIAALPQLASTPARLKKAVQVVKDNYFGVRADDKAKIFAGLETGSYPFDAQAFCRNVELHDRVERRGLR
jgi:hypothetical protein